MTRSRVALAFALAAALSASSTRLLADVRADQKSLVKFEGMLGRIVNIFGGKSAREGVKTSVAVKGDRKSSLTDASGQIVDLKEEKIYEVDVKKKSYKVTTFAELRQQMEAARKKAEEEARKAQASGSGGGNAAPEKKDPNAKEVEVDFNIKDTGEKKTINGFDTHQVVMTITVREKGKTLEQSGGLMLTSDIWLTKEIAAMKEIADFDLRYAKALAGPMVEGVSADQMAQAMAMYPGLKDAMVRMSAENVKLTGTPILTTVTVDAVKSAEQMAAEASNSSSSSSTQQSSSPTSIGGLLGGFGKGRGQQQKKEEPSARATFMTITNETTKVTTDVAAGDVDIPAGYKLSK
jgi:hypothetical protein